MAVIKAEDSKEKERQKSNKQSYLKLGIVSTRLCKDSRVDGAWDVLQKIQPLIFKTKVDNLNLIRP